MSPLPREFPAKASGSSTQASSTRETRRAYDIVSRVYDETREEYDGRTFDEIRSALTFGSCPSLLEIGVGTGRVSAPLQQRHVLVTGLDVSVGMLARARLRGVEQLVRGDALHLPFSDQAFDASLFVSVLHIVTEPKLALREAGRVSRHRVLALFTKDEPIGASGMGPGDVRKILGEVLAELGCIVPPRLSPSGQEERILKDVPPDTFREVSKIIITEPPELRLDWIRRGGDRTLIDVPPLIMETAISQVRAKLSPQTIRWRRSNQLLQWDSARL